MGTHRGEGGNANVYCFSPSQFCGEEGIIMQLEVKVIGLQVVRGENTEGRKGPEQNFPRNEKLGEQELRTSTQSGHLSPELPSAVPIIGLELRDPPPCHLSLCRQGPTAPPQGPAPGIRDGGRAIS